MGNMQGVSRELLSVPLVHCKLYILIFSLGLFDFEKNKFTLLNDSRCWTCKVICMELKHKNVAYLW